MPAGLQRNVFLIVFVEIKKGFNVSLGFGQALDGGRVLAQVKVRQVQVGRRIA
ncbi:MAG: hypothetical protein ACKO0V_10990 [bacterium]